MKFYTEQTHCWDCGAEFTAATKQYFLGTGDEAGFHASCPDHNRGYGYQVAPTGTATIPVEVEIDLAGSRRKTEEALRDTLRLLSPEDCVRLLAAINCEIEAARHNGLAWTHSGFVRK